MKDCIQWGVALLPIAIANAILPRQANLTATTFRVFAVGSNSAIELSYVNASGNNFWIGKNTASYCPLLNATLCPAGTDTAFENTPGEDNLALVLLSSPFDPFSLQSVRKRAYTRASLQDTIVAGGQAVYVAANGALSFTRPRSAYLPPGSKFQGFQVQGPVRPSYPGIVRYNNSDFLACPTKGKQGPYQIFVGLDQVGDDDVPGGCVKECIGFIVATQPEQSDEPAAYGYR